ncbi:MAG TPA: hypothetical protein PKD00_06080 [Burkholderiales bacterium]|nr:hypothetical protein [Burkholderiales bacterium]
MLTTELTAIIVAIIGLLSGVFGIVFKFGGDYLIKKMEIKAAKKKEVDRKTSLEKLKEDIATHSAIDIICEEVNEFVNSDKCTVWMFHNGGYYYTGNPIQRISMVAGVSNRLSEDLKLKFTNLPIGIFSRNLEKLLHSNFTHERNELAYTDTLAVINSQEAITSSAMFKISSADKEDWVGVLAIGWQLHRELTEEEKVLIESKVEEISKLLTPKLLSYTPIY